jgi:hypothetical protein
VKDLGRLRLAIRIEAIGKMTPIDTARQTQTTDMRDFPSSTATFLNLYLVESRSCEWTFSVSVVENRAKITRSGSAVRRSKLIYFNHQ